MGYRVAGLAIVQYLEARLQERDQELDVAIRERSALRDSLEEMRVENARLSEKLEQSKQSNTTAPLVIGSLVFSVGLAMIYQGVQGVPPQHGVGVVVALLGALLVGLAIRPRSR